MSTNERPRVCVFCGSNVGADPAFLDSAIALGAAMGERGIGLVYGGGEVGLMGAVADGVLTAGGEVIGVIPESLVDAEIAHPRLTRLEVTAGMHERKARMAALADGFIGLPGGFGTFEEVIEVLTWNQLGLLTKPVVFFDVGGFYAPLLAFFDRAVELRFVRASHRLLAQRAETVDEALELATAPTPPSQPKWIDRDLA
jgi:uncharacterized protein (TIGR00730 family)